MKLSEWKNEYLNTTSKVSELTRQLAFAGIAVVWVFRAGEEGAVKVPNQLIFPLLFLCGSLLLDFCHNLLRGEVWKWFYRREERKLVNVCDDPDVVANIRLRTLVDIFYYSKILLLVVSYVLLVKYLISILV